MGAHPPGLQLTRPGRTRGTDRPDVSAVLESERQAVAGAPRAVVGGRTVLVRPRSTARSVTSPRERVPPRRPEGPDPYLPDETDD